MILFFCLILSLSVFAEDVENLEAIEVTHQGTSNTLVDFVPSVTTLKKNELKKRKNND